MTPKHEEGLENEVNPFLAYSDQSGLERKKEDQLDEKEQILEAIGSNYFLSWSRNLLNVDLLCSVWGKYQFRRSLVILVIIWLPTSFHLLNMVFYRAETNYWCSRLAIFQPLLSVLTIPNIHEQ